MIQRPVPSGTCWVVPAGHDRSVVLGVSAPACGRPGGVPAGAVDEQVSGDHRWQIVANGSSLALGTYGVFGNPTDLPSEGERRFNGRGTKVLRRGSMCQRLHTQALAVPSYFPSAVGHASESAAHCPIEHPWGAVAP